MNENENTVLYNNKREREREREKEKWVFLTLAFWLMHAWIHEILLLLIIIIWRARKYTNERKKEFKRNPNKQLCGSCGVWQGGVIIKCPFRTAQRWHCKKEGGSAAAAQWDIRKKRTRGKGQLFALCIVHYTKPIVYLKNVWKKKDEFLFFFQLLWIEIDRRERGKKKEQTILYNRNRSTAEKNTHTHTRNTRTPVSLSLPLTSPPTSPDIEKTTTFWFSFWSASKWNCQHDKKRKNQKRV